MKWRLLFVLLPLGLGILLATLLTQTVLANPTYRVLISLSTFLLFLSIGISMIVGVGFGSVWLTEQQTKKQIAQLHALTTRDRRRFLQRLDHELKNPLMAIRAGLANFANAPTPELRRSALATVDNQAIRLSRLTTDLRKIAELENRPLERSEVDLEPLLREAVEVNQERVESDTNSINLITPQAPWPLPMISADWDLIYLAVHNLLDNSLKYNQPGGTIEVRGREDGHYVVIEVADTGPGIDSDDLPHVWEELYRGQGGRTAQGSGLGLALVKAIVDRHGGTVAINSKVDQGTVVTLHLPKIAYD